MVFCGCTHQKESKRDLCAQQENFLPAEMLSSGEQQEQKVSSPEERQKVPAEMLEGSSCFFGKQELEFLCSDGIYRRSAAGRVGIS